MLTPLRCIEPLRQREALFVSLVIYTFYNIGSLTAYGVRVRKTYKHKVKVNLALTIKRLAISVKFLKLFQPFSKLY